MLESYARQASRLVIGLMSGTSADGIDAALVRIAGDNQSPRIELVAFITCPYPDEIRERLLRIDPETSLGIICALNFTLGELFANAALEVMRSAGVSPADVDLIGSHGQTVCHWPPPPRPSPTGGEGAEQVPPSPSVGEGWGGGSTLQIAEPAVIAQRTGIITIADFRVADVAAGGEGAPLVPIADFILLRHPTKHRIVQNIGGIANLTYLPPNCTLDQVIAFDTGPGNMVTDGLVQETAGAQFDTGGYEAARGNVNQQLLTEMMAFPFIERNPPKTTGREEFGTEFRQRFFPLAQIRYVDALATATAFTVESIAHAYRNHLPCLRPEPFDFAQGRPRTLSSEVEVIVGGGGAYNTTMMKWLAERIAPWSLLRHEDVGIPSDAKEAIAFALLAHRTACGLPGNVPQATGAKRKVVLGKVCYP